MRLWLKEGSEAEVEELLVVEKSGRFMAVFVDPLAGEKYIDTCGDRPGDPTFKVSSKLLALMKEITVHDVLSEREGLRPEGIYHYKNFTFMVRTTAWASGGTPCSQAVHISGPADLGILKEAYTLFRQGVLKPAESWQPRTNWLSSFLRKKKA
jgi:hypothetical protein